MPKDDNGNYLPPEDGRRCKAIKRGGGRCQAYAVGPDFCNFHDPEFDIEEATRKGGQNSRKVIRVETVGDLLRRGIPGLDIQHEADVLGELEDLTLETPDDVLKLLNTTANAVLRGRIDPQRAQMISYLCNTMLSAMRTSIPGGGDTKLMPEITEIERSPDSRATSDDHPGTEFAANDDALEREAN